MLSQPIERERPYGAEDLDLFVPHTLRLECSGRLHGSDREKLEHVVLKHVAEHARCFVIPCPVLDAKGLCSRDLYVIDVPPVPEGFEYGICEPQHQNVLDRFLGKIVIDPKNLVFLETLVQRSLQSHCRWQVSAKGLLNYNPREPVAVSSFLAESSLSEHFTDERIEVWRNSQIEDFISQGMVLLIQFFKKSCQIGEGVQ